MVQEEQAYVKVEDGIVMVRHGGFWRLRQYEIPEETIRPLEKKGSSLTLDDYIGFVSQLTDAQAESLRAANPPVAGFALEPIRNALPALRFLSALPNDPPSGQPISYAAMGGNLQALYVSAVQQALFWGGTWAGSGPGPDPRRYAFLMSSSDVPGSGGLVAGTSFLFGSSRENAAQFQASARN